MKKIALVLVCFFLAILCFLISFYVSTHVPFEQNGALKAALLMVAGIVFALIALIKLLYYIFSPTKETSLGKTEAGKDPFLTKEMYEGMVQPHDYNLNVPGIPTEER